MDPLAGFRSGGVTHPFEPGVGMGMENIIPAKPILVDDLFVVRFQPSKPVEEDAHQFGRQDGDPMGGELPNVKDVLADPPVLLEDRSGGNFHDSMQ